MLGDPSSNAAAHGAGAGSLPPLGCYSVFSPPPLEGDAQDPPYVLATGPNVPTVPLSHHIQLPQLITSRVIPRSVLLSLSLPHPSNQLLYSLYNLSICTHPQPFPGLAAAISRVACYNLCIGCA